MELRNNRTTSILLQLVAIASETADTDCKQRRYHDLVQNEAEEEEEKKKEEEEEAEEEQEKEEEDP